MHILYSVVAHYISANDGFLGAAPRYLLDGTKIDQYNQEFLLNREKDRE
jgi:hypothetical protein